MFGAVFCALLVGFVGSIGQANDEEELQSIISMAVTFAVSASPYATSLELSGTNKEVVFAAKPDAALYKLTGEVTPSFEDAAEVVDQLFAVHGIELTDEQIADLILVADF